VFFLNPQWSCDTHVKAMLAKRFYLSPLFCLMSLFCVCDSSARAEPLSRPLSCQDLNKAWSDLIDDFRIAAFNVKFSCPSTYSLMAETFLILNQVSEFERDSSFDFASFVKERVVSFHPGLSEGDTKSFKAASFDYATQRVSLYGPFFSERLSAIDRAAIIVHEARHADSTHVICKGGIYEGRRSCDRELSSPYNWKGEGTITYQIAFYKAAKALLGENAIKEKKKINDFILLLATNNYFNNKVEQEVLDLWLR